MSSSFLQLIHLWLLSVKKVFLSHSSVVILCPFPASSWCFSCACCGEQLGSVLASHISTMTQCHPVSWWLPAWEDMSSYMDNNCFSKEVLAPVSRSSVLFLICAWLLKSHSPSLSILIRLYQANQADTKLCAGPVRQAYGKLPKLPMEALLLLLSISPGTASLLPYHISHCSGTCWEPTRAGPEISCIIRGCAPQKPC